MMDQAVKAQIRDSLKQTYFSDVDDLVDISEGDDEGIHVVIVSRKFDGQRMAEKNDLVWGFLVEMPRPEVWRQISLTVCASPEEVKAI